MKTNTTASISNESLSRDDCFESEPSRTGDVNLAVVGASFRTAGLELREQLAFRAEEVPGILRRLHRRTKGSELLLLVTCNRTELYLTGPAVDWPSDHQTSLLLEQCGVAAMTRTDSFYQYRGRSALEHLMAVAAGLDSMVVGETEVFGQLKQAYAVAWEAGVIGPELQPLLTCTFGTVKRVRSETGICRGRVSVGSIAVDLASNVFEALADKTVMIVGAGEIAEEAVRNLADRGVSEFLILNRSLGRADTLAQDYGGAVVPIERLDECLGKADVVISSTAAPHCVIGADAVERAIGARPARPMLLIDLAVPRDIATAAGGVRNVHLYNIDDLRQTAAENLARRRKAASRARQLIREEVESLPPCSCASELTALMQELDAQVDAVAESELRRAFQKQAVAPDDAQCAACREQIRIMLHRTLNKIMASPRMALREASRNGDWEQLSRSAKRLFGVENGGEYGQD